MRLLRWIFVTLGVLGGALALSVTANAAPLPATVAVGHSLGESTVAKAYWGYRRGWGGGRRWGYGGGYGYRRWGYGGGWGYRRPYYRPWGFYRPRPYWGYRRPYYRPWGYRRSFYW